MHNPVLLQEMLSLLSPKDGEIYMDATFGAGGYSKGILNVANCEIYAIDRDETTIKFYDNLDTRYSSKIKLFIQKFSNIKGVLSHNKVKNVNGVVFDIGVSSMQIDTKERGFSFMHDAPLNMSMDGFSHMNAFTFVNSLYEKEIADTIYNYGGERHSRKIARAIVSRRKKKVIKTTHELANIVRSVVPRGKSKIDPATRTFQAIRIWVNDELKELQRGIEAASEILDKDGKLIVVSFHSLEDQIVKNFFKSLCELSEGKKFTLLNKKVIKASVQEVIDNPRSRSAKLRAIHRIA